MMRPTQCESSMVNQDDLLYAFQGQYGRLCQLVARAITQGHTETDVIDAAMGKGDSPAPVYTELRRQRERVDRAQHRAQDSSVPFGDLLAAARRVNLLAREEWMIRLPAFSEKT